MTTFNFAAYVPLALRTEAPLPTPLDRLNHALLGLITETGEFTAEIKRIAIYGKSLDDLAKDGKTTLRQHIAEEIGDTLWYLAIAADALTAGALEIALEPLDLMIYADSPHLIDVASSIVRSIGDFAGCLSDEESLAQLQEDAAEATDAIMHDLNVLSGLIGIPLQQIADENIAKLALRYPEKFTAEAAEARADKGGEDARNS